MRYTIYSEYIFFVSVTVFEVTNERKWAYLKYSTAHAFPNLFMCVKCSHLKSQTLMIFAL